MCTVLLPPGFSPSAVKKIYRIISKSMVHYSMALLMLSSRGKKNLGCCFIHTDFSAMLSPFLCLGLFYFYIKISLSQRLGLSDRPFLLFSVAKLHCYFASRRNMHWRAISLSSVRHRAVSRQCCIVHWSYGLSKGNIHNR
jgi:hypothetical protein